LEPVKQLLTEIRIEERDASKPMLHAQPRGRPTVLGNVRDDSTEITDIPCVVARRDSICAYRCAYRLVSTRCNSLQFVAALFRERFAACFNFSQFVAAFPAGLLIPRSQVRSLPGPSEIACIQPLPLLIAMSGQATQVNKTDYYAAGKTVETNEEASTHIFVDEEPDERLRFPRVP
jgi:hypothetical protein